ncbi:MAG TPA: VWA domain-containing protein, partial [Planctomycetaceae bacterium]|nr:VWA domain-containing protein [Planctomycetaceae bacterium]
MSTIPAKIPGTANSIAAAQATADGQDPDDQSLVWSLYDAVPAWGISLLLHACIFLVLLTVTLPEILLPELNLTSSIEKEEVQAEEYVIDSEPTEQLGSMSNLNIQGASAAIAQSKGLDNHREEIRRIESAIVNPKIETFEALTMPRILARFENIDLLGTTEHPGGTEGAVDRMTLEIAASLRQRRTLPVWLFDESISLEHRREEILARFENVYRQLGLMDDIDTKDALKTGIVGYGKDVHILMEEPTSDVEEMLKAVKTIKSDVSGVENVFAALNLALKQYAPLRRKMKANMMFIIVTDERGDDFGGDSYAILEDTVRKLSREGVRVYCIGNSSPFGRQKGYVHVKWTAPDGTEFEDDIPDADQGPETPLAEGLQLPFWTANAQQLERMSSGYGPYTLSRLCAETGGIFFVADDTTVRKWDPQIMRQYAPDYRPGMEYRKQLQSNLAKQALIAAAQLAVNEPVPVPQRVFQANNDNILREQITEAQKPLAVLDYFLQRVHEALEIGEKHRDKLDTDRWRAQYDLAMGRVLAMRVRAYGYNSLLAEMKSSPKRFEKEGSNQWTLQPSEKIDGGANVRKMHDKALMYLNRIIEEHPETPWAFLAKIELSEPLGWEWRETQIAIPQMGNGNGDSPRRPVFAPEEEER